MSDSIFENVKKFHVTFGGQVKDDPEFPADEVVQLRESLILEECDELVAATAKRDIVGVADALADIIYVAIGTAHSFGIDLDRVLAEVHRSNMSKLGVDGRPLHRSDGKVLKGPNYSPPDIESVLFGALSAAQGAREAGH